MIRTLSHVVRHESGILFHARRGFGSPLGDSHSTGYMPACEVILMAD